MYQTAGTDISCCLIDICFRVCHCNIVRLQWPIVISINYWHFLKRNYDLHSISTIYDFSSEKFHLFQFMSIILVFVFSLDSILYCKAIHDIFSLNFNTLKCIIWCKDKMGHTVSEIGCMHSDIWFKLQILAF